MKNIILKIILLTTLAMSILCIYLWFQNLYHLDMLIDKSMHFEYKTLSEIKDSEDLDFIKQKYSELFEIYQKDRIDKNEILEKTMNYLIIGILTLILNITLIIIELNRRKKKNIP